VVTDGPTTRLDCGHVREDLAEYVLGVLAPQRAGPVAEHLAWCAGCRKEAAELAEGAAAAGLAVTAEPPAELEDRVVAAVTRAAGRQRRRGTRVAVVVAAAVAAASVGLAGAMAGRVRRLEDAAATARERADRAAQRFEEVLEDLGGATPVLSAPLHAAAGDAGGRALLFDAEAERDFALVIVGGLSRDDGPYMAYLVSPSGRRIDIGRLRSAGVDQLARYRFFDDLAGARDLVVVDRSGRTVLTASFPPA
jgi:anti-sigma factor RsiW